MKPNNYYLAIASIVVLFDIPTILNAEETKTTTTREINGSEKTEQTDIQGTKQIRTNYIHSTCDVRHYLCGEKQ